MTKGGLTTTIKTLLARMSTTTTPKTVVGRRCMSKVARWDEYYNEDELEVDLFKPKVHPQPKEVEVPEGSCWIPDPRTGIYYPKGHEWVMKDIPDGAASFAYSYCLRNSDSHGV